MNVAAVRQTADWLADATTGVNALLASVPRDVGDPAPPDVTIYDETTAPWVARLSVPRGKTGNGPLLLVRGGDEVLLPLFGDQGDGGWTAFEVLVAYVRRAPVETVESDDAVRDCLQTLRAAARSIALQYQTQEAAPRRTHVDLARPTLRLVRDNSRVEDELIYAMLAITFPAADSWAMAATA